MATYTAVAGGGNWSNNATWGGGGHPVAGDTAVINATMTGTVTVDVDSACAVLNLTNNGGTLAFGNYKITVTGGVTLGGTVTAGSGGLVLTGTQTLTAGGITFPGYLTFNANMTATLSGNWVNTGLVSFTGSFGISVNKTAAETLTCNGGLTHTLSGNLAGSATLILGGSGGTYIGSGGVVSIPITINCTDLTISGVIRRATGTITYVAGTITTTGSTLQLSNNATLNTDGIVWDTISFTSNLTTTLGSKLTCAAMSMANVVITFSGAYDIECDTLVFGGLAAAKSLNLVAGQTLDINTAVSMSSDFAVGTNVLTVKSVTGSSDTYIHYHGTPANCKVAGVIFTDVDASGGNTIYNFAGGTLTRTDNIVNITPNDVTPTDAEIAEAVWTYASRSLTA